MIGRHIYGLGAILAGAVGLAFRLFIPAGHPLSGHLPIGELLILGGDVLLILGGIAINLGRRTAAAGAIVLGLYFAVSLLLQAPGLLHEWNIWVTWQDVAESTAMSMGGLIAWSLISNDVHRDRVGHIARLVFGLCLLVFGTSHIVYLKYTAALVPAWLPPSQVFWTWLTGAGHIAAGLAILSGIQSRLAAMLLTTMFVVFDLLVQLPSVIHDPHSHANWSENGVTLVLIGAAWCVAESLVTRRRRATAAAATLSRAA